MPTEAPSSPETHQPELDAYALDRIEYRVQRLARVFTLSDDDADDLRQDLVLELWRALPRYDAERAGLHTYVNRVLDRAYCAIARSLRSRRSHPALTPVSLSVLHDRPLESPELAAAERCLDLEAALATLPRHLRIIAEELKHAAPGEVAQRLHIHRASVYRAIKRIRQHLEEHGVSLAESRATDRRVRQM